MSERTGLNDMACLRKAPSSRHSWMTADRAPTRWRTCARAARERRRPGTVLTTASMPMPREVREAKTAETWWTHWEEVLISFLIDTNT